MLPGRCRGIVDDEVHQWLAESRALAETAGSECDRVHATVGFAQLAWLEGDRARRPSQHARQCDRSTGVGCIPRLVSLVLPFVEAYQDGGLGLLGDPTRRAIFELLARRPSSVGELAQQLPISRPAVSQHLRVLKDGGLVVSEAQGTRRVYRLNPDGVAALRAYLDRVWTEALTAFHKAAEAAPTQPEQEQE